MFSIHSVSSDRELVFSSHKGDYFEVRLKSFEISALSGVWAYTDTNGLNALFQKLAGMERPWQGALSWENLEGDFEISVTCTTLGHVTFLVKFWGQPGSPEEWRAQAGLITELGQLEKISKDANAFFQENSA